MKLFNESEIAPPTTGLSRRFEAYYDGWDGWCILDHATDKMHSCEDRFSAEREADSLELVDQVVRQVASHFTVA